jgi:hypothetical protein
MYQHGYEEDYNGYEEQHTEIEFLNDQLFEVKKDRDTLQSCLTYIINQNQRLLNKIENLKLKVKKQQTNN